jgi:hypothetical protein
MPTKLILNGTTYLAADRAAASLHVDELQRALDGYDTLKFSVRGGPPAPIVGRGQPVSLTWDYVTPGTFVTYFVGEVTDIAHAPGPLGWTMGYTCQGLRYQADRVPITAPDGTAVYTLNPTPEDSYYVPSNAGLALGEMFKLVLCVVPTATALDAIGVGGYTTLSPPTLPTQTLADLDLLTVVPPSPVPFTGVNIFGSLSQLLARYMPKYALELTPTGIVRFKDTTDATVFVPYSIQLPCATNVGATGAVWPSIRTSSQRCFTRMVLRGGPNVAATMLKTSDGTLVPAWTNAQQTAWRLSDFTQPKDGYDVGTIISVASTSVVLQSANSATTWVTNFWDTREGVLYLTDMVGSFTAGIDFTENRAVTSCDAMTAGGTATVSWDASNPITATAFTNYTLMATAGSLANVGRLYSVGDAAGNVGLDTWVGSHLVTYNPLPVPFANNTQALQIFHPSATVWSQLPYAGLPYSFNWVVAAVPATGQFLFTDPTQCMAGNAATLAASGYPTTVQGGLPVDVQVLALYSKGPLEVIVPPDSDGSPTYEGTAYSVDGIEQTCYMDVPAWRFLGDTSNMTLLAQQHLDVIKNTVFEGNGEMYGLPPWDFLTFGTALNYLTGYTPEPFAAMAAPIRGVTVRWNNGAPSVWSVGFSFSNQRKPFTGDDLYSHPGFRTGGILDLFGNAGPAGGGGDNTMALNMGGMGQQAAGEQVAGQIQEMRHPEPPDHTGMMLGMMQGMQADANGPARDPMTAQQFARAQNNQIDAAMGGAMMAGAGMDMEGGTATGGAKGPGWRKKQMEAERTRKASEHFQAQALPGSFAVGPGGDATAAARDLKRKRLISTPDDGGGVSVGWTGVGGISETPMTETQKEAKQQEATERQRAKNAEAETPEQRALLDQIRQENKEIQRGGE